MHWPLLFGVQHTIHIYNLLTLKWIEPHRNVQDEDEWWHHRLAAVFHHPCRGSSQHWNNVSQRATNKFQLQLCCRRFLLLFFWFIQSSGCSKPNPIATRHKKHKHETKYTHKKTETKTIDLMNVGTHFDEYSTESRTLIQKKKEKNASFLNEMSQLVSLLAVFTWLAR